MLTEYIEEALKRARYEIIDDEEPYYYTHLSVNASTRTQMLAHKDLDV